MGDSRGGRGVNRGWGGGREGNRGIREDDKDSIQGR